ncbi:MAG: putative lipopolysaccharide heptosyltransferase III [Nitrospirota bacterium]
MTHEFKNVEKILVIKLRHIGDVLLAVPVFRALRENLPHTHIAALVNSGTEEVLTGNPLINEIIVFDRSIKKLSLSRWLWEESIFLRRIKNKHFDMTVDLTSGDRAAIISFISGARYRLAYNPNKEGFLGKKYLYTHLAQKDGSQHMVLQNLDIVKQFGINTDNLIVDIFIPEDAKIFVKRIFNENGINEKDTVVHVHPTSRWLFKCWKDEYMAEVISWLLSKGIRVIVTSSPDKREMEKAKRILSLCSSLVTRHSSLLIDLCGRTTIKQLAAISESSDLFLGIDSAPMHIAAAVDTPVIALFGPTGDSNWRPWYTGNSKDPHIVVRRNWACGPCGGICEDKISKCLYDITPREIIDVLEDVVFK